MERTAVRVQNLLDGSTSAFQPHQPSPSQEDLHELRVRIPVDLHRQLLSLKVLRGRSLAETVSLALDIYFSQQAEAIRAVQAARRVEDAQAT